MKHTSSAGQLQSSPKFAHCSYRNTVSTGTQSLQGRSSTGRRVPHVKKVAEQGNPETLHVIGFQRWPDHRPQSGHKDIDGIVVCCAYVVVLQDVGIIRLC